MQNMKKNIKLYLILLILPFMVISCLDNEITNVSPNLAAVSNLQYALNGDSVKLTWNLPAGKDSLGVVVIPNSTGAPIALKMNATSYTYGIVEVNKPLMYTVKITDTKGNTSLGQTVKFTRAGASPIKNVTVSQVDNNVVFSWAAPDSAVTGIVLKYSGQTVNISATATTYQISNAALGTYHFQLYTTNNRNQVSQNTYLDLKVGATYLAYVGDAADSTAMVTTADDDQAAGAKWFFSTYPKARYISFNMIKNGYDLSKYRVIWWNYDIDNGTADLPAIATDPTVLAAMTTYHKNGGNLLLSTYAIQYLWTMGRMTNNYSKGIDKGAGGVNPDVWGIGVSMNKKHDQSSHPIYNGIAMTTQGDGRVTFPCIGNGWKENHNFVIMNIPSFYEVNNDNELAYTKFSSDNNAVWLGQWDGIGDYWMVGIFELTPKGVFQGSSISIGIGGIEFKVNDGTNPYQSTIQKLYKNAIDYLKTK
jgi:hypothetical protein